MSTKCDDRNPRNDIDPRQGGNKTNKTSTPTKPLKMNTQCQTLPIQSLPHLMTLVRDVRPNRSPHRCAIRRPGNDPSCDGLLTHVREQQRNRNSVRRVGNDHRCQRRVVPHHHRTREPEIVDQEPEPPSNLSAECLQAHVHRDSLSWQRPVTGGSARHRTPGRSGRRRTRGRRPSRRRPIPCARARASSRGRTARPARWRSLPAVAVVAACDASSPGGALAGSPDHGTPATRRIDRANRRITHRVRQSSARLAQFQLYPLLNPCLVRSDSFGASRTFTRWR